MMRNKIKFSFDTSLFAKSAERCTADWLNMILDDNENREHCMNASDATKNKKWEKSQLAVAFFQGELAGNSHVGNGAKLSGLVALDIDDHDGKLGLNAESYISEKILPRITSGELSEIAFVHITPSGNGIRVVAVSTDMSKDLQTQQKDLFKKVGGDLPVSSLDTSKAKPESAFFLPCREYVRYLDEDKLFNGEVELPDEMSNEAPEEVNVKSADEASADVHTLKYGELYLDEIMQTLIARYNLGVKVGDRNNNYYKLACYMRHFNQKAEVLIQLLPSMGLPLKERQSTLKSALKGFVNTKEKPHDLQRVIDDLNGVEKDVDDSPKIDFELPKAMETILEPFPKSHREAMAIMMLPGLAQISYKARFVIRPTQQPDYKGDMITMMAVQAGLFASGKSSGVDLVKRLVRPHALIDEETQKKLMDFNDNNEIAADGEKKKDPHYGFFCLEADTNLPAFNKNMCNLQGKPCIVAEPEIDDFNDPLSFLRNRTIIRKGYDQDMTGQLRSTSKGFSGKAKILLNLAVSGTVGAVLKFFKNVDNGEVSRIMFCSYPNERGSVYVPDKIRSERNQRELDAILNNLMNWEMPEDPYPLDTIKSALEEWAENKRLEFNFTGDEAMESFRRRCKTIGIKAGAIAFLLEGGNETEAAVKYALWVAEYTLYQLLKYFGKKMNESANKDIELLTMSVLKPNQKVFLALPEVFSNEDVRMMYQSLSLAGSGYRTTIRRWLREGFIEPVEGRKGFYRKTRIGVEEAMRLLAA